MSALHSILLLYVALIGGDSYGLFSRYSEGEIHFNLMAVVPDRRMQYQKRLQELTEVGKNLCSLNESLYEVNKGTVLMIAVGNGYR